MRADNTRFTVIFSTTSIIHVILGSIIQQFLV